MSSGDSIRKFFNDAKKQIIETEEDDLKTARLLYHLIEEIRQSGINIEMQITPSVSPLGFNLQRRHAPDQKNIASQAYSGAVLFDENEHIPFAIGHFQADNGTQKSNTYLFLSHYKSDGLNLNEKNIPSQKYDLLHSQDDISRLGQRLISIASNKAALKTLMPNIRNHSGEREKARQMKLKAKQKKTP